MNFTVCLFCLLNLGPCQDPFWSKLGVDVTSGFEEIVTVPMFPETRRNGSISICAAFCPSSMKARKGSDVNFQRCVAASVPATMYLEQRREAERFLLQGNTSAPMISSSTTKRVIASHWKPWLKLRFVLDMNRYNLRPSDDANSVHFPPVYFDELHLPRSHLIPLSNDTTREDPKTRFRFVPTSVGVFRLLLSLQQGIEHLQTHVGLSHVETDEALQLLSPDNLYVLALTYTVSILHAVFAGMAFKNEISFWRGSKNLYGMSRRSVVGNAVCSLILFLFLYDSVGTSWLVIGTMGCHAVIDFWKVTKVLGWRRELSEAEEYTNEIDAIGMRYLWYLLWPLILGWSGYSLFAYPHRSWYSWALTSAAHGVYGFGFLLMWPQIFVNYRMKSVAHLPWRALTYKIFTTFVDDLFAWIINAPTIHRLATLRDDLVFFVYLYQRFAYGVDKTRVNEYGYVGDPSSTEQTNGESTNEGNDKSKVKTD